MKQLSLTYKLFILVLVISVSALGLYSLTVLNDFSKDKLAYVFDSSLEHTKSTAMQTKIELEAILGQIKQVMIHYDAQENSFNNQADKTIQDSQKVKSVAVFLSEHSKALAIAGDSTDAPESAIERALQSLTDGEFSIQLLANTTDSVLIGNRFKLSDQQHLKVISVVKNVHFLGQFLEVRSADTYLLDEKNRIRISPMKTSPMKISRLKAPMKNGGSADQSLIEQLPASASSFGVQRFETKSGEKFIISYADTSLFGLKALSIIPYSSVLKIIDSIKQQSIFFALFLVGLIIIISLWSARTLTSNIKTLLFATERVGRGELDQKIDISTGDEIGRLAMGFNKMLQDLKFLLNETAEKARMESELKTAQLVQSTLFPQEEFKSENVELYGFYESASECGGDWWHHQEINGKLYIWIGDATGHGAPAALVASAAKSASSIIEQLPDKKPNEILAMLNHAISSTSRGQVTMTFFVACLDLESGLVEYSNASHECPFLMKSQDRPLGLRSAHCILGPTGARIGEKPQSNYELSTFNMEPGDRFFFYTDGITELLNSQNEMFGERRLLKSLTTSFNNSSDAKKTALELRQTLELFKGDFPLQDDLTYIMVDFLKT